MAIRREVRITDTERLPEILVLQTGSFGTDVACQAFAEDGKVIAGHVSSSIDWALRDMGLRDDDDSKHELYREKYPGGYAVIWPDEGDPRIAQVRKNKQPMPQYSGPSAMVAFVRVGKQHGEAEIKVSAEGPILWACGDFLKELQEGDGGWDIGDHNVPDPPPQGGLLVLEGFIEVGHGEDADVTWDGDWRLLSHWEMLQIRFGKPIWEDPSRYTDEP